MKNSTEKVLCVGSMGKDIFFPLGAEVVGASQMEDDSVNKFCFEYGSKVHIDDRFSALGGCACNVSTGLSRLNIRAAALGNIGSDADGKWIVEKLRREGVNTDGIRKIAEAKTDISMILVDMEVGERTIFVNRDVGEQLVFGQNDLTEYTWCFVGSLYGDAIRDNMRVIHDAVVRRSMKIVYNPGGQNIAHDETVVTDLIHHAEIVFVNKSEAQAILGHFNVDADDEQMDSEEYLLNMLRSHMSSNSARVILTDGRRGAWMYDGAAIYHTDTVDKSVHDATGAGDAFASGFLAGAIHGWSPEKCMQWGSANGDAVIDYYGAQEGLLRYDTMEERSKEFKVKK